MLIVLFYLYSFLSPPPAGKAIATDLHAVYVSVVEISHITSNEQGTMQVKLFTDDLEDAIHNQTGQKVKLNRQCENNFELMGNYLKQHLVLMINGITVDYQFVGCENLDISTWLEIRFACDKEWTTLQIKGDQLMELFPTQSNVFSIKYDDQKSMFRLTNSKKSTSLTF